MSTTIDARGLSCPQPVLMALQEIKRLGGGEFEILVDTDTARENVSRAAASQGWQVRQVRQEPDSCRILIGK